MSHLFRNGIDYIRVAVAEQERAVTHNVVDVLITVYIPLATTIGVCTDYWEGHQETIVMSYPVREHLCCVDLGLLGCRVL